MTIHAATNVTVSYGYGYIYVMVKFLESHGWTITWSSNGTTGGAGGSYLTSSASLNHADAYVVIQDPAGGREHLFRWYTTSATYWNWFTSQGGLYTGGTASTDPTATDQKYIMNNMPFNTAAGKKALMACDDAAPYGWWMMSHNPGNFAWAQGQFAQIPIDGALQPGETEPEVFFQSADALGFSKGELDEETSWSQYGHVSGSVPGQGWQQNMPAIAYYDTVQVIPNGLELDANNDDLSLPIMFGRRGAIGGFSGFKGASSFIQWNGFTRAVGETFAGRTRISLGDANLPWDGVTTPRA